LQLLECKQITCMQLKLALFLLVALLKSNRIFDTIVYTHKDLEYILWICIFYAAVNTHEHMEYLLFICTSVYIDGAIEYYYFVFAQVYTHEGMEYFHIHIIGAISLDSWMLGVDFF
jgi:hypothetical protein